MQRGHDFIYRRQSFLDSDKADETDMVERFLREAANMKDFKHPHVLGLVGVCFETDGSPMVVLPYMANGDLQRYIQDENKVRKLDLQM